MTVPPEAALTVSVAVATLDENTYTTTPIAIIVVSEVHGGLQAAYATLNECEPAAMSAWAKAIVLQQDVEPEPSRVKGEETEMKGALLEDAVAKTTNAEDDKVNVPDNEVTPVLEKESVVKEADATPIPPAIGNRAPFGL